MNEATPVSYTAVCERVGRWWEITVPELDEVTQTRTLDEVPETVVDLVATMTGADPASVEVNVTAHEAPGLAATADPELVPSIVGQLWNHPRVGEFVRTTWNQTVLPVDTRLAFIESLADKLSLWDELADGDDVGEARRRA